MASVVATWVFAVAATVAAVFVVAMFVLSALAAVLTANASA